MFNTFYIKTKSIFLFFSINYINHINLFLNTGCFLYPLASTCLDNLTWSIGSKETMLMNDHYQLWAKLEKHQIFKLKMLRFILQNFNWVSNWVNSYFLTKFLILFLVFYFFSICGSLFLLYKRKKFKH